MSENKDSCHVTYHETPPPRDEQKPGDYWTDADLNEDGEVSCLYMILPDGSDAGALHVYRDKKPAGSFPSWKMTGDPTKPKTLTLHPSIHYRGKWHGWLRNGFLKSC